jgi:hypothetical protein
MARKFIIALFGSWLMAPMAIIFAQLMRFSTLPSIRLTLLVVGITVPFQLFLNEVLVPILVIQKHSHKGVKLVVNMTILFQMFAILVSFTIFSAEATNLITVSIAAILVAFGNILSYHTTLRYTHAVCNLAISGSMAGFMGAVPGLVILMIYVGYYCVSTKFNTPVLSYMILGQLFIPAVVQQLLIVRIVPMGEGVEAKCDVNVIHTIRAVFGLLLIVALSVASNWLRQRISILGENYSSLVLVAMNATLSLTMVFTKVQFLKNQKLYVDRIIIYVVVAALAGSCIIYFYYGLWAGVQVLLFLATQVGIVLTISKERTWIMGEAVKV